MLIALHPTLRVTGIIRASRLPQTRPLTGRPAVSESAANVTQLLRAAASGERRDLDALMHAIYDDLRRLAISHVQSERADHTLQPTALVHEAYLKLIDQHNTDWKDRAHFFALASRIIRRILVDHARQRHASKRGGGSARVALDSLDLPDPAERCDLVALDAALSELVGLDEMQARIVEMRYFGGLTLEEIAESLQIGRRSVDRHWAAAKAWLMFRLESDVAGDSHE
jgi:RNA polymerase sigma factor (TIGR02999 family)